MHLIPNRNMTLPHFPVLSKTARIPSSPVTTDAPSAQNILIKGHFYTAQAQQLNESTINRSFSGILLHNFNITKI